MQGKLEESTNRLRFFAQRLPSGGHDYGQLVGEHTRKMIAGESGSALTALEQLRPVLNDALDALEAAQKRYREYEDSAANATNIEVE